ncbi:GNAT family N-acetyltransferase [Shewanella donghaensis]|uniref:GNAT family N-acetyltransferase n=1 Tax=Shewanella donghaensis TaxID=238836 RepID=UPI0011820C73|nr:GNAT family N-acetyltransferase [Shewanella donghaensis]
MQFNIRKAQVVDVNGIANVHFTSWAKAFKGLMQAGYLESFTLGIRIDEWAKVLSENSQEVLVAEIEAFSDSDEDCGTDAIRTDNGRIVGFLSYTQTKVHNKKLIELSKLYLDPTICRKGLGSVLIFRHAVNRIISI